MFLFWSEYPDFESKSQQEQGEQMSSSDKMTQSEAQPEEGVRFPAPGQKQGESEGCSLK